LSNSSVPPQSTPADYMSDKGWCPLKAAARKHPRFCCVCTLPIEQSAACYRQEFESSWLDDLNGSEEKKVVLYCCEHCADTHKLSTIEGVNSMRETLALARDGMDERGSAKHIYGSAAYVPPDPSRGWSASVEQLNCEIKQQEAHLHELRGQLHQLKRLYQRRRVLSVPSIELRELASKAYECIDNYVNLVDVTFSSYLPARFNKVPFLKLALGGHGTSLSTMLWADEAIFGDQIRALAEGQKIDVVGRVVECDSGECLLLAEEIFLH